MQMSDTCLRDASGPHKWQNIGYPQTDEVEWPLLRVHRVHVQKAHYIHEHILKVQQV